MGFRQAPYSGVYLAVGCKLGPVVHSELQECVQCVQQKGLFQIWGCLYVDFLTCTLLLRHNSQGGYLLVLPHALTTATISTQPPLSHTGCPRGSCAAQSSCAVGCVVSCTLCGCGSAFCGRLEARLS